MFFGEEVDANSVIIIPLVCSYVLGTDILFVLSQCFILESWRFEWYWIYSITATLTLRKRKQGEYKDASLGTPGFALWVRIFLLSIDESGQRMMLHGQRRMLDELDSDIKRCHNGQQVDIIAHRIQLAEKTCWPPRRLRTYGWIHLIFQMMGKACGAMASPRPLTSCISNEQWLQLNLYWYQYGCFQKYGKTPQIIHFNRVFHYKPSILGYPYFWKYPYWYYCSFEEEKSKKEEEEKGDKKPEEDLCWCVWLQHIELKGKLRNASPPFICWVEGEQAFNLWNSSHENVDASLQWKENGEEEKEAPQEPDCSRGEHVALLTASLLC